MYALPDTVAHHLATVLRLRSGAEIRLFNGQGGEYAARIESVERKRVAVRILQHDAVERASSLSLTLAQGVSRGQKMDYTIQKAVELGCHRIVPILNERSTARYDGERSRKKLAHWRAIVIAACEQCGQNMLPRVDAPIALQDWLEQSSTALKLILDPTAAAAIADFQPVDSAVIVMTGSESGWTRSELEAATAAGYARVQLGPRVLRTETAAVTALSLCQHRWGDLG